MELERRRLCLSSSSEHAQQRPSEQFHLAELGPGPAHRLGHFRHVSGLQRGCRLGADGDSVFSPDPSTSTSTLVRRQQSSTTSRSSRTRSSSSTASSTTTQSVSSPASTDLAGEDPVLRIGYPQGSYSHRTGGTQFYATPLNDTNANHERMLLSYDVWFPTGFGWVHRVLPSRAVS